MSRDMGCGTCERIRQRDAGKAPLWDAILRTDAWDVVHSYDTSLLGWMVLVPRRHVLSVDELTGDEARELGRLIQKVSAALKAEVACAKTYVMQFAEHPEHPHVHFHVVPRRADLPEAHKGPGIFHYLSSEEGRITDAAMSELALRIREHLG
jgi:diadenosine tetraphosphate (Ap4A) HIT family hydrolase